MNGWIGVDLDGTLAQYPSPGGHYVIGAPIEPMMRRVRAWLARGIEVRIFTARASVPEEIPLVEEWLLQHFGRALPVTNVKDFGMIQLWDDRAVQIRSNRGEPVSDACEACLQGLHPDCRRVDCACESCNGSFPQA